MKFLGLAIGIRRNRVAVIIQQLACLKWRSSWWLYHFILSASRFLIFNGHDLPHSSILKWTIAFPALDSFLLPETPLLFEALLVDGNSWQTRRPAFASLNRYCETYLMDKWTRNLPIFVRRPVLGHFRRLGWLALIWIKLKKQK